MEERRASVVGLARINDACALLPLLEGMRQMRLGKDGFT